MPKQATIYTTRYCPHCRRAKKFLKSKNIPFVEMDITEDQAKREEIEKRTGWMTVPLIFIGEESDRPFVETVTSFMREPFHSLVGRTALPDLVALIRASKLVVTNDSASLHIASLVGTPTVAIFGPTAPRKYGPRAEKHRVVRKDLFCSPCEKARCPYHHECMEELPAGEVYQACCELLA